MNAHAQAPRLRLVPALKVVFVAAALAGAAYLLHARWDEIAAALRLFGPEDLALAALAAGAHVGFSLLAWMVLIKRDDAALRLATATRIFFLSQIGKYIPGSVWQFVAAAQLGHDEGMTRRGSLASFVAALIAAIVAGAALVLAVLPQALAGAQLGGWSWAAFALLPLAAFFPAILRRVAAFAQIDSLPGTARLIASALVSLGTWLAGGAMLFALARGLFAPVDLTDIIVFAAIYAAAWITGFLVFFAPAGLGARETAMIAMLSAIMPLAEATILALLSRILVTLADFIAAGATLALTRPPAAR